jgi:hypothetical protein
MWGARSGIDWDWEMPAVTAGGAHPARPPPPGGPTPPRVRPAPGGCRGCSSGLGCLVLILTPAERRPVPAPPRPRDRRRSPRATVPRRSTPPSRRLGRSTSAPSRSSTWATATSASAGPDLAVKALESAVRRDPENWRVHYGLALVRAADGQDPRPTLRTTRPAQPQGAAVQRRGSVRALDPQGLRRASGDRSCPSRASVDGRPDAPPPERGRRGAAHGRPVAACCDWPAVLQAAGARAPVHEEATHHQREAGEQTGMALKPVNGRSRRRSVRDLGLIGDPDGGDTGRLGRLVLARGRRPPPRGGRRACPSPTCACGAAAGGARPRRRRWSRPRAGVRAVGLAASSCGCGSAAASSVVWVDVLRRVALAGRRRSREPAPRGCSPPSEDEHEVTADTRLH